MTQKKIVSLRMEDINPFVRHIKLKYFRHEAPEGLSTGMRAIYDHQFLYVFEGKGLIEIEGNLFHPQRGDLFFIEPTQKHCIVSNVETPLVLLGIQFDFSKNNSDKKYMLPAVALEKFNFDNVIENVTFIDFEGFRPNLFFENPSRVEDALTEMANEYRMQKRYCSDRINALMLAFIFYVARYSSPGKPVKEKPQKAVESIIDYIHKNFNKPVSVREVAALFHFHPSYINKLMIYHTSVPVHQYIINLRICKALELLNTTDKTVDEIANLVGFEPNYFSKVFKKKVGRCPSHGRH
jgi:AraC-like DNA-binding protein